MQTKRCRQCGFKVVIGGRLQDAESQKKGFCSHGCDEVYHALMEKVKQDAINDIARLEGVL